MPPDRRRLRHVVAPPPPRGKLTVEGQAVVKIEDEGRVRREADGLRNAAAIPTELRNFDVPEVLSVDGIRLVTRRMPSLVSLRRAMASSGDACELANRAGAALATIHEHMHVPATDAAPLPPPFDAPDPVPLHGDFSLVNVQVNTEADRLVILDWAMPPWVHSAATHGSALWDVSMFLVDLHYQRVQEPQRIGNPAAVSASFVAGYRSVRPLDATGLAPYLRRFVTLFLRTRTFGMKTHTRIPDLAGMVRLQRGRLMRFARTLA